MAIQVYSFSASLDIDCDGTIADMTILKNTFPVTPVITPDSLFPYITFAGYVVDIYNCVFNTNFGYTLIDDSGSGAGYTKTGMVVPRVQEDSIDTRIIFRAYSVKTTLSLTSYPFLTSGTYYFNFKEYKNI